MGSILHVLGGDAAAKTYFAKKRPILLDPMFLARICVRKVVFQKLLLF